LARKYKIHDTHPVENLQTGAVSEYGVYYQQDKPKTLTLPRDTFYLSGHLNKLYECSQSL
jgi:hypothetical protein